MRNLFNQFSLEELNRTLRTLNSQNKVNNLKVIAAIDKKNKMSVTLKPRLTNGNEYHGLHPKFDEDELFDFLDNKQINNPHSFWRNIQHNTYDFKPMNIIMPDKSDFLSFIAGHLGNEISKEVVEESLLGKAILQMSTHYGFKLYFSNKELGSEFQNVLSKLDEIVHINYSLHEDSIDIKGIWPESAIKELSLLFDIDIETNNASKSQISLKRNTTKGPNKLLNILSFKDEWRQFFSLTGNYVYYSGVMPCVRQLSYELDPSYSQNIKYVSLEVVRTTFATLDMMDNSTILKHTFFERQYKEVLNLIDFYEDTIQQEYLYSNPTSSVNGQIEYELQEIKNLNHYLRRSLNTHTIAVSANLTTSDNYLLAGKRGSLNIDSGEIYCSANGQTEFRDKNVAFYQKSVFEDLPTLEYHSDYRIDLNQEMERESIAELGITSYDPNWEYYGISYLSINKNIGNDDEKGYMKSRQQEKRRMHFNILMNNQVTDTFEHIVIRQKLATESFENEKIIGYKITVSNGWKDYIKKKVRVVFDFLYENNSRVLLVLIFFSALFGS